MKFSTVTNPQWVNAEHTAIDCQVTFDGLGEVPFTATPTDTAEHGREIFARAIAGEFGPVGDYVPPPPTPAQIKNQTTTQSVTME